MKLFTITLEYCNSMIWLLLEGMAAEKKEGSESTSNIFGYIKWVYQIYFHML